MIILPAALALFGMGCGDNTTDGGGTQDMAVSKPDMVTIPDMTFVPPPAPKLGMQIDRLGRGTINVAVTNPFNLDSMQDQTRDKYNQDADESKWVMTWAPTIAKVLAIYDGADAMCGNQIGACGMAPGCGNAMPMAGRYDTLAGVLADDRLYLDTSSTTCNFYLAVEAGALGIAVPACGGRTPTMDVVDEMYTAATVGLGGFKMDGTFAITDGVAKDNDGTVSLTAFPFLGDPN